MRLRRPPLLPPLRVRAARPISPAHLDHIHQLIAASGLLLILLATLWPFRFDITASLAATSPLDLYRSLFRTNSDPADTTNNLLLFIPFGFGLAGVLRDRLRIPSLILVALIGGSVSFIVEAGQLFQADRTSTISDVLSNTISAALGWGCYQLAWLWSRSAQHLLVGTALYLLFAAAVACLLQFDTRLTNWNLSFPISMGNEQGGQRGWEGNISELRIATVSLSPAAVSASQTIEGLGNPWIADYDFDGRATPYDRLGLAPDLAWIGPASAADPGHPGVTVGSLRWLRSRGSAAHLSERLRESAAFTLVATVAPKDLDQRGPARIFSISQSIARRNLTVGQEGDSLVVRLRTPATGINGTPPELVVPGAFPDTSSRRVIVSYDGRVLRAYVDGVSQRSGELVLVPELGLLSRLLPPEAFDRFGYLILNAQMFDRFLLLYRVLFCALLFIPLGMLLGLLASRPLSWPPILLIAGGAALAAEIGLSSLSARPVLMTTIVISMIELAGSLWLFSRRLARSPDGPEHSSRASGSPEGERPG